MEPKFRSYASFGGAPFVITAGFIFLYLTRLEQDHDLEVIIAGFVGAAVQFLFGAQVAQQAKEG